MPFIGLLETLTHKISILNGYDSESNTLNLPDHSRFYYSPGYMVIIAALARKSGVSMNGIKYPDQLHKDYAEAVGITKAIWGKDTYEQVRINDGRNYSQLIHLDNEDATDKASAAINGCIRNFFPPGVHDNFVNELCDLVGDLHSNVWAHGMDSGFSMAQKNKAPNTDDFCLEFALADTGMGFLSELNRVGKEINNDKDAINWCIQEGHSTKKHKSTDEWAQAMPDDIIGNPLRGIETTKRADNSHHMGLGLFKLIELVKKFNGELRISSGDSVYLLNPNGAESYISAINHWKGVAISCKFNTGHINDAVETTMDLDVQNVLNQLRRT